MPALPALFFQAHGCLLSQCPGGVAPGFARARLARLVRAWRAADRRRFSLGRLFTTAAGGCRSGRRAFRSAPARRVARAVLGAGGFRQGSRTAHDHPGVVLSFAALGLRARPLCRRHAARVPGRAHLGGIAVRHGALFGLGLRRLLAAGVRCGLCGNTGRHLSRSGDDRRCCPVPGQRQPYTAVAFPGRRCFCLGGAFLRPGARLSEFIRPT